VSEKQKFCKLLEEALKDEEEAPKKYQELARLAGEALRDDVSLQHLAFVISKVIADQEGTHERLLSAIRATSGCPIKE